MENVFVFTSCAITRAKKIKVFFDACRHFCLQILLLQFRDGIQRLTCLLTSLARWYNPLSRRPPRHRSDLLSLHLPPTSQDLFPVLGLLASQRRSASHWYQQGQYCFAIGIDRMDDGYASDGWDEPLVGDGVGGNAVSVLFRSSGVERIESFACRPWGVDGVLGRKADVYIRYLVAATTIWSGASYVYSKDAVKILSREEIEQRSKGSQ